MTLDSIVAGGGVAGLVMALAYAARQLLDWWRTRGTDRSSRVSSAVTDAAAANALLLAALREERDEVLRLSDRVQELESQNEQLYQRIREQRREYEQEIGGLRRQIEGLSVQLDALQQRLRAEPERP